MSKTDYGLSDICDIYDAVLIDTSATFLNFRAGTRYSELRAFLYKKSKFRQVSTEENANYIKIVDRIFRDHRKILVTKKIYEELQDSLRNMNENDRTNPRLVKNLERLVTDLSSRGLLTFDDHETRDKIEISKMFASFKEWYRLSDADYDMIISSIELGMEGIPNAIVSNDLRLLICYRDIKRYFIGYNDGFLDAYTLLGLEGILPRYILFRKHF